MLCELQPDLTFREIVARELKAAGGPARFFHIPGAPPFECFQVSVHAPQGGRVAVTARAIDTNDDTEHEMDQTWDGSVAELDAMLAIAIATVRQWRDRERSA